VHLEIELQSDPIAGTLTGPGGEVRSFQGWIELTDAIEQARVLRVCSEAQVHARAARPIQ
jgi:hypothetical protein